MHNSRPCCIFFFFFNDTATTEIYTLSLHDALPISRLPATRGCPRRRSARGFSPRTRLPRSEEHTSELQSLRHLVCRLLLEKKKKNSNRIPSNDHKINSTREPTYKALQMPKKMIFTV